MSIPDDPAVRAVLLRVRGVVQGVGYRASLRREARRLGLQGWVRNRADGSVEAHVQGSHAQVSALLAWAGRGPPAARVEGLDSVLVPPGPFADFDVRPTE